MPARRLERVRWPGLAPGGVVALAALALLVPIPAPIVDTWYADGIFPVIQHIVTPVTNVLPVALFDILLLAVAVWLLIVIWRGTTAGWRAKEIWPIATVGWRVIVAAATLYVVFLAMWGLNYQRVPLVTRFVERPAESSAAAVRALADDAVAQLNELYPTAQAEGWTTPPDETPALRDGFWNAQRLLGDTGRPVVPGRLKATLLGPFFRWAGVDGMINPFGLETLVNPDLLPFERPMVAAHEWAHLAGWADEAEASFVGWLACVHGDAATAYSGWLHLYWQIRAEVDRETREALDDALDPGPRADLTAIAERLQRDQVHVVRTASWAIYDRYLQANRIPDGVRRYGAVVTLTALTVFEEGWVPVLQDPPELSTR